MFGNLSTVDLVIIKRIIEKFPKKAQNEKN